MKSTTKSSLGLVLALGLGTTLLASMTAQKAFVATYPDAKAKLGKCGTCHTKPMPKKEDPALNAYGKDLAKSTDAKTKECDFAKAEALDSDGDGVKNIDEIKAGTNPGDAASK